MLLSARISTQWFRRFNKNFVSVCSKYIQSFGDKLVERHCLLGLLAVHQLRPHPGWRYLEYPNTAVAQKEALRQHIGVECSFGCRVDSSEGQGNEGEDGGVVENYSTTAFQLVHQRRCQPDRPEKIGRDGRHNQFSVDDARRGIRFHDSSVIDENVQVGILLNQLLRYIVDIVGIGDVE